VCVCGLIHLAYKTHEPYYVVICGLSDSDIFPYIIPSISTITNRDREELNVFERKVCRRIQVQVHDNEKRNLRILTNKEIYAIFKNPAITETIRCLDYFGLDKYREWKETEFAKE
jgi:hypothetical protein